MPRGIHKPPNAYRNGDEISKYSPSGLLIGYPLGESAGTKVYDVNGSIGTGTFSASGCSWTTIPTYGRAVAFDGADSTRIVVPVNRTLRGKKRFTVEMIMSVTALNAGGLYLYHEESELTNGIRVAIAVTAPGGQLYCYYRDSVPTAIAYTCTTVLTLGKPYHVVYSMDTNGTCKTYLNGVLDGSIAGSGNVVLDTAPISISLANLGTSTGSGANYKLSMFNIWPNVAFSQAAVSARYADPFSLYWPYEEDELLLNIPATGGGGGGALATTKLRVVPRWRKYWASGHGR